MDYLDFDLEITSGDDRTYTIVVLRSPAGEARETKVFPLGALELENRLQALEIALLRSNGQRRQVLAPEEQAVQDFGYALFMALLPGEIRSRYDVSLREAVRQGKGLRIRLRIQSPTLAALPWEFVYDSRRAEYVCLSRNTPIVRYLELPHPVQPMRAAAPLRILGMTASPKGLPKLDVALEKRRMETALADLQAKGLVSLTWTEGETWRDLQRVMRFGPWHIFHFIGHGGFDSANDEGFVALSDQDGQAHHLSATFLGRLLADHQDLRLVVLNACEGARGSGRDVFSSTAAILVRRGLPAVLAMQYAITDHAAIEFARTFYESLADRMPVDAATTEARQAISIAVSDSVEWGIPVLYMRAADGALFDVQPSLEPARVEALQPVPAAPATSPQAVPQHTGITDMLTGDAQRRALLIALYRLLIAHFSDDELRTLCFFTGVDYEMLSGAAKGGKARELIEHLRQRRQIAQLIEAGKQVRDDVDWTEVSELLEASQAPAPSVRETPAATVSPYAARQTRSPLLTMQPFEPDIVRIPAGLFVMGSDPQKGEYAVDDEQPQHTLALPDYYLSKTPVTNAHYAAFVKATGHHKPVHWQEDSALPERATHPVVNVSWFDALAYCHWLASVTGKPYTLPSEAEWEKGARGVDGRIYPWGKQWDASRCNIRERRKQDTTAVDAYPLGASPYGILDVAGNVWEWTRTVWGIGDHEPVFRYPYDPDDGREDLAASNDMRRVLRGGSFNYGHESARCACRNRLSPDSVAWYVGFRVAILVKPV